MNQTTLKPAQVISTLNSLIELNRDGQKGFQDAGEKANAPQIKTYFFEQSLARAHFVGELQTLVHALGEEPDNTGTVAGALQRGWLDLKSALGGGDHAILAVIETVGDHATTKYRKTLAESLPSDVRDIVEHQFQSVLQAHDKVKALRDSLAK